MRAKLNEVERSVILEIPRFSSLAQYPISDSTPVVSYGSSPFLVHGRKWGINVYPQGHFQSCRSPSSRIDVYVHIYARDERETESEFLSWVQAKRIRFDLTITEPEPQVVHVAYSSQRHWSDMEDGAGWWYFALDVASPLLELTNDTLVVSLAFDEKAHSVTVAPPITREERLNRRDGPVLLNPFALNQKGIEMRNKMSQPLYPSATLEPAMLALFNNPNLSDYAFHIYSGVEERSDETPHVIHVQKGFLQAKLPNWTPSVSSSTIKSKSARNREWEEIRGIRLDVVNSFLMFIYSGQLPILDSGDPINAYSLGQLCLLCEQFGHTELRRFLARHFYCNVNSFNVIGLLRKLGGRSDFVQEILAFVICKDFAAVKESNDFKVLMSDCIKAATKFDRCSASKRYLAVLRRLKTRSAKNCQQQFSPERGSLDGGSSVTSSASVDIRIESTDSVSHTGPRLTSSLTPAFDPRRLFAFRKLLSTASVSDVQFLVQGKTIFAQKCILASLSDVFAAMFSGSWVEGSESGANSPTIVEVVDFPYKTFQDMLTYLYLEELDTSATLTELGLLHICADKYQVLDLVSVTANLISTQMSCSNVTEFLFDFAFQHDSLNALSSRYFVEHFDEIRKQENFVNVVRRPWEYAESWIHVWSSVLSQLEIVDFERVGVLAEESGGPDDLLDPNDEEMEEQLPVDEVSSERPNALVDVPEKSVLEESGLLKVEIHFPTDMEHEEELLISSVDVRLIQDLEFSEELDPEHSNIIASGLSLAAEINDSLAEEQTADGVHIEFQVK